MEQFPRHNLSFWSSLMYLLYHGSVGTYGTIHFELWMVAASMHSNFEFRSSPLVLPIADLFQPPPTDFRSIADPPTGRHPDTPSIEGKHIIQKQKSWSQNPLSNTNLNQQAWPFKSEQQQTALARNALPCPALVTRFITRQHHEKCKFITVSMCASRPAGQGGVFQ